MPKQKAKEGLQQQQQQPQQHQQHQQHHTPDPNSITSFLQDINTNPYVLGLAYILLNLGGRFMVLSVTPAQEAFLQNIIFRPLLLFAIMFIGTRNMVVAFWLTLIVLSALHYLFNEQSDWYLLREIIH